MPEPKAALSTPWLYAKTVACCFFRFPSIDFWRQKWIKALKINQTTATQICSRHFEDQYFDHDSKKAKLSLVAVPTLNLGFDENEVILNTITNTYKFKL